MENLPWIIRICILGVWLFAVPAAAGGCLCGRFGGDEHGSDGIVPGLGGGILSLWVCGQMLLWAGFQLICVPFVLLEKEFYYVAYCYGALAGILTLWGLVRLWQVRSSRVRVLKGGIAEDGACEEAGAAGSELAGNVERRDGAAGSELSKSTERVGRLRGRERTLLAVAAGALLVFQLLQAVGLAYADGDDAYYVAVSSITNNSETMYRKLPYTGGTTLVDIRHGLAPFPIWIAFLARVTGLRAAGVAHVAVAVMTILMAYAIYWLLARELFPEKEKRRLSFLIMTELLVLFGDYSFYTVEHFMLARGRQGKAALGSIILPMLLLLLLVLMRRLQEDRRCGCRFWALVAAVMISGCLCSTLGAFLLSLFIGVSGICAAVAYRRWRLLVPMALCCLPCVCFAVIYLLA